jgi:hypothetical protein
MRRFWTEAEVDLLREQYNGQTAEAIAKRIGRTAAAVHCKAQLLKLDVRVPGEMSQNEVMEVLGMQAHQTLRRWSESGLLASERRPGRGRRAYEWVITDAGLIEFLRTYPWMVDRDRVEPPFRSVLGERWITLVEAFKRGAAFPNLLENAVLAGLIPEAKRRLSVWVVPESTLPRLVAGRRTRTDDGAHRKLVLQYDRLQRRGNLARKKTRIVAAARASAA